MKRSHWNWLLLALLVVILATAFIVSSARLYHLGFPLDDAWIHQTYARNLVQYGEWTYGQGNTSAGSTSPLWTILISLGYLVKANYLFWTVVLGCICLYCLSLISQTMLHLFEETQVKQLSILGLVFASEWHLVWAALSGMETILLAMWGMLLFYAFLQKDKRWFLIGILIAFGIWIRPDGVTFIGPALLVLAFSKNPWKKRLFDGLFLFAGVALLTIPYFLFNFNSTGSVWPNTFFAKQAEYSILRESPIWLRFGELTAQVFIGAGVLLAPGLAYLFWKCIREKNLILLSMYLWLIGYIYIYALRLPVIYQHARYLIPVIPEVIFLGLLGSLRLARSYGSKKHSFILTRVWMISFVVVLCAFIIFGIDAYAEDVAIIESEMVTTAKWIRDHTQNNAIIAAHDIGALGYFGNRQIIDLAGLINPDVIPILRDEDALIKLLNETHVDYLVTFPGWYPKLVKQGELVFTTGEQFSPSAGGENMHVYRWKIP